MIAWKDIIRPIQTVISTDTSVEKAFYQMKKEKTEIALVKGGESYVGYCTLSSLLAQVREPHRLEEPVSYNTDIITVPETSAAEFPHNISVIVSEDKNKCISGFITLEETRNRINEQQLIELNEMIHGSGVGIIKTNTCHEIEFMNEKAESTLGIPSSFLLGWNYKTLITMNKNMDQVVEGETMVSVSSTFNYKQISGNFYPLRINGKIKGLAHIFFRPGNVRESSSGARF